jgi:hypothetical protein
MVDQNNCNVATSGTVFCDDDVGGANGVAYSSATHQGEATVSWTASQTANNCIVGFTENPTGSTLPYGVDYGIRMKSDGSQIEIRGSVVGVEDPINHPVPYTTSTVFKIIYDGATIKFYVDGVEEYSTTTLVTGNMTFHADTGFYIVGTGVENLLFGGL